MNVHEYQGKEILSRYGVRIQRGIVAETSEQAVAAYQQIAEMTNSKFAVVKSQIHAGGRGKGSIVGIEQRGVQLAKSADDVTRISTNLLGNVLVTIQTGAEGKRVNKILVAEDAYYPGESEPKEYYMGATAARDYLNHIKEEKELNWTFFSPALEMHQGITTGRTGKYRLGLENPVFNEDNRSILSVEDLAVVIADEAEEPKHHQVRFTAAY